PAAALDVGRGVPIGSVSRADPRMDIAPILRVGSFFFTDTATTEIYTLSLHDALPILARDHGAVDRALDLVPPHGQRDLLRDRLRSEEHTSELQSRENLVCRLLLVKKNRNLPGFPDRIENGADRCGLHQRGRATAGQLG